VPIVAINFDNQPTIQDQKVTDQIAYGGLGSIANSKAVQDGGHRYLRATNEGAARGIVAIECQIAALNRTESSYTFIKSISMAIKLLPALFTGPIFASAARLMSTFSRAEPLACIVCGLKLFATHFAREGRATRCNTLTLAGAILPTLAATMFKLFTANLTDMGRIAAICRRAGNRAKSLVGWGAAGYCFAAILTGDLT